MDAFAERAGWRPWCRAAAGWTAAYVATWGLAACLRPSWAEAHPVLPLLLEAVGLVALVLASALFVVDQGRRDWGEGALAAFVLGGFAAAVALARFGGPDLVATALRGLALCSLAFALGRLLVNRVEKAWWLLALLAVAMVADLWSVLASSGLSRELVRSRSFLLDVVLLAWPLKAGGAVRAVIGVADFVFFALFVLSARKFAFPRRRTEAVLVLAMLGTIGVVGLLGLPLPVVPALALTFVVLHGRDCLAGVINRAGEGPGSEG